jgi:ATP-dependent RNA helicase DeaD
MLPHQQRSSRIVPKAAAAAAAAPSDAAAAATGQDSTLSDLSVEEPTSFTELGVDPLLVAGLAESGIEVPSPIQESAIPVLLSGANAAIQSYTGSGKVSSSSSSSSGSNQDARGVVLECCLF